MKTLEASHSANKFFLTLIYWIVSRRSL